MLVLLQEPALRTKVHETAAEARLQLNRRTFYHLELSRVVGLSSGQLPITANTLPKLLLGPGRGGEGL